MMETQSLANVNQSKVPDRNSGEWETSTNSNSNLEVEAKDEEEFLEDELKIGEFIKDAHLDSEKVVDVDRDYEKSHVDENDVRFETNQNITQLHSTTNQNIPELHNAINQNITELHSVINQNITELHSAINQNTQSTSKNLYSETTEINGTEEKRIVSEKEKS